MIRNLSDHAASFALIAYASSWMKCHHPDVLCCALLNAQPMGFYAPAQIVRDAQAHEVEVRPVSVNDSRWDCTLEMMDGRLLVVRLGMRMVKGLANAHAAELIAAGGDRAYDSVDELRRRAGVPTAALERLAGADAFRCLGPERRAALCAIRGLRDDVLPLFAAADAERMPRPEVIGPPAAIAPMTDGREVVEDYAHVGLTLRQHPVTFLRGELDQHGIVPCADLLAARDGRRVTVAGLVLVRQRPGTATGVIFITLEDETGIANLIVWSSLFERQRRIVLSASMLECRGRVQREGDVIHVVADQLEHLTPLLRTVGNRRRSQRTLAGRGPAVPHFAEGGRTPAASQAQAPVVRGPTRSFH